MNGRSQIIETPQGRVIIAKHPDSVFLYTEGGVFLTPEDAKKLSKAIWYAAGK
jgi:hypothetical protein